MEDKPDSPTPPESGGTERTLSECLFSQYMATLAGIAGSTGYSLYRKPKNGLALLAIAGAAGSIADLAYGWNVACQPEVERFLAYRESTVEERRRKRGF
mmetsp:Transcript_13729/g.28355  ORF Transcript_13729/g.28355 Transcript_13729/m.28355 type:complete len:99 (+) Transcript_13729:99-395(+)